MGCDIHGWLEVRKDSTGKWIGLRPFNCRARQRNYRRFALLAGVRGAGDPRELRPKGLPLDISDSVLYEYSSWGDDAHTPSWITLQEAVKIFKDTSDWDSRISSMSTSALEWAEGDFVYRYFGIYPEDWSHNKFVWENYRIVFWFDN